MDNQYIEKYLKKIDEVIDAGKYKDNWASLHDYPEAKWYKAAKFGIFIHWGLYSVPAYSSEWYARQMYIKDSEVYNHHIKTYGPHKKFGYKDFIPMFKAEKFDPKEWVDLFKASGAKYVMPVAEHHDGFQMYDSEISDFNSVKMGPKRNIVGELKTELEKQGLVFSASSHRAENYWFFGGGSTFDSGLETGVYQEPYGYVPTLYSDGEHEPTHNVLSEGATKEHLEDWLVRTCELVDKYQPKVVWFDWWIQNISFKPYLKKFAAYYYNRALEWGVEVAINYKYDAYALSTAVFDVERGQLQDIRPRVWQTDTAIAKNSWGYTENNDFKNPVDIVCDLIDIISKNGLMLLNVGPKSDGTITDEEKAVLLAIGKWLKTNGEAIYDTTYWSVYGEGPTEVPEGAFTDINREQYTTEDIRFTYNAPYVYAHVLKWPKDNKISIKSLRATSCKADENKYFIGAIKDVELLGYDREVTYDMNLNALDISVDKNIDTKYPVVFKVTID